jgi:hypothetical protein
MNTCWCPCSIPLKEELSNGPYSLRCDFSVTYSCLLPLKAFLRVFHLIVLATKFTAVLRAGFLVSCHNFRILSLCLNIRSKAGRSLLKSKSVILLVDSLYSEAIEAEKSRARFIGFYPRFCQSQSHIANDRQSVCLS